jgi:RHS repeat-associated protein
VSFYNYDGHGSVRGLSNNLGNTTDTYTYDAFGTLIEKTGNTDNNYLYAGEQFDSDLGFYYNRARYLNVSTGRFISQDSYEGNSNDPLSLHKYLYANADSVNNVDASGNFSFSIAELTETLKTYAILFAINFPRLTQAIVFTAEVLTPIEVSASLPSFGYGSGLGALFLYGSAKELSLMRRSFLQNGMFAGLGTQFESWIGRLLSIPPQMSQIPVLNGVVQTAKVRGSAVIDYIYRGTVLEIKGTGAAAVVKENQAKQLAIYADAQGLGLSYIFMNKPTQAQITKITAWVKEVAPNLEPTFNYLFP